MTTMEPQGTSSALVVPGSFIYPEERDGKSVWITAFSIGTAMIFNEIGCVFGLGRQTLQVFEFLNISSWNLLFLK